MKVYVKITGVSLRDNLVGGGVVLEMDGRELPKEFIDAQVESFRDLAGEGIIHHNAVEGLVDQMVDILQLETTIMALREKMEMVDNELFSSSSSRKAPLHKV